MFDIESCFENEGGRFRGIMWEEGNVVFLDL